MNMHFINIQMHLLKKTQTDMNRQWGAFHLQCLRMPTHITTIGLHTQARDQTSGLCNRIENKLWLSFSLTHTQTLIFPLL